MRAEPYQRVRRRTPARTGVAGFPQAFVQIVSALYVPLSIAALGIVLRGSGFAFLAADVLVVPPLGYLLWLTDRGMLGAESPHAMHDTA